MALLASIRGCIGGILTVEIGISAVIYVVFVNYVVQHFSNESYLRSKSYYERAYDYVTDSFSSFFDNIFGSILFLITLVLIAWIVYEWRRVYNCYLQAKRAVVALYDLMKETERMQSVLEQRQTSLSLERHVNLNGNDNSLREVLESAKLTESRRKPLLLSARPLSQGTPRKSISYKVASELFQRKLRELEQNCHKDTTSSKDSRAEFENLRRELGINVKQLSESYRANSSKLEDRERGRLGPANEGGLNRIGGLTKGVKNSTWRHDSQQQQPPSSGGRSFQEVASPYNRPLVMAETTSVLTSHRFSPETSIPKLEILTSLNVRDQLHNVVPQVEHDSSVKLNEIFRKRNETRRQIDVCLNQLDESLMSQCDSIATQQSFITSPRYNPFGLGQSNRSRFGSSARAMPETFKETEGEIEDHDVKNHIPVHETENYDESQRSEDFFERDKDDSYSICQVAEQFEASQRSQNFFETQKNESYSHTQEVEMVPYLCEQITEDTEHSKENRYIVMTENVNYPTAGLEGQDLASKRPEEEQYQESDPTSTYRIDESSKLQTFRTESSSSVKETYRLAEPAPQPHPFHENNQGTILRNIKRVPSREGVRAPSKTGSWNENSLRPLEVHKDTPNPFVNRRIMTRISTPFHAKESSTSSTDLDNYCGTSGHGDDAFNITAKSSPKKADLNAASSSGDHASPTGEEDSSLASRSHSFESNELKNERSAHESLPLFTPTGGTESEFFKTNSTFESRSREEYYVGFNQDTARNCDDDCSCDDFSDDQREGWMPPQMSSMSWSREPDIAALQLIDVPKIETCQIDNSLCIQAEFATLSLTSNSIDGATPRNFQTTELVQKIHNECRFLNVKQEKCLVIELGSSTKKCRLVEHESYLSFELLSYLSDIYIERPIIRKLRPKSRNMRSPQYSSAESRNISSPSDQTSKSRLPVPVNRYPSSSSTWSAKGSPRQIGRELSTDKTLSVSRRGHGKNSNSNIQMSLSTEFESFSIEGERETNSQVSRRKREPDFDFGEYEPSGSKKEHTRSSSKSSVKNDTKSSKEGKHMKLTNTLKHYSRQNVFNRLYK